ncbi:AcrR family transcriptional regulator [Psychromicrobium silvestre]|uniref:AcrR family transcriptional regulator n=1 Tax=Psychromicrobium silvestre TaxID=1645614 RepID=A0A7Y9S5J0_9MICC|nr:TetR/AcrR family transcriptional regulator [Psychromicrobium silvestre]NYE94953.1 AcrR family transcriptional regulator [Psychromicrobium silvestre]
MARPRKFDVETVTDSILEEFWSNSFAGTSTEDLCTRTGLSRSSLYNTFRSKADAYQQALERYYRLKETERSRYADLPGTGRELVEQLMNDVISGQLAEEDRRICLVVHACVEIGKSDPEVAALAEKSLNGFEDLIATLVQRGQDDGSINTDCSARDLAGTLHAVINGLQVRERVSSTDAHARRIIQAAMSLF